ncbi:MAG: AsmA family protein [Acidobacteriaceae bacterium]
MSRARILFLAAFALLVFAIVVPPFVNINRFRHSIVQSISAGLDRPVYADAVELTLFPRPAFVLHHLTVAEWPEFGSEPVITAETVTASLRASTLWHRRVEIARLHFDAPSVNLARDSNGQWNFESLIGNSPVLRLPATPGPASTAGPPPFPYVEATDARINFKRGAEKLPLSLEGADLAFWKESGNEWHVRIKARPVRTDLPPGDAGQILGEASAKTSGVFMDAPITASLEWRRGQLGEISRLLHGEDSGWRGSVDWTAEVRGTLAKAQVTTDVQVEEFRRAEFIPPSEIDLAAHCTARYVHKDRGLDKVDCNAPMGGGHLLFTSTLRSSSSAGDRGDSVPSEQVPPESDARLEVTLQHISAGFFLDLLRHIHPGVAAGTTVSGEVNGNANCKWRGLETLNACAGELRSTPLTLSLPHVDRSLHFSSMLLSTDGTTDGPGKTSTSRTTARKAHGSDEMASVPGVWDLAPARVSLTGVTSATVAGTLTSSGISLNIDGPADLRDLNQLARAMNFPVISGGIRSIRGDAQMALILRSNWLPQPNPAVLPEAAPNSSTNVAAQPVSWFVPSQWSGTLQIHNATLRLGPFPGTFQIAAAQVGLMPTGVEWRGLTGTYAHIPFDGSIVWQTLCPGTRPPCGRTFTLHTSNLNVDRLQGVLRHTLAEAGLLEQLNPWAAGAPDMPEISGTLNADLLTAGKLPLKDASLKLHIQGHHADVVAISGNLFGGTLTGIPNDVPNAVSSGNTAVQPAQRAGSAANAVESGVGSAQWGDGAPVYTLRVVLENIQPDLVAAVWHEKWGRGIATAQIRLKTHGWTGADMAQNASGNFAIDWRNGTLAASMPPLASSGVTVDSLRAFAGTDGAMRFQRLRANGHIRDRKLVLEFGQMLFANLPSRARSLSTAPQSLSGTVTFSRELDLQLQPSAVSITGPLDRPIVRSRPGKASARGGLAISFRP